MNSPYFAIFCIAGFVIYPFVTIGLAIAILRRTGNENFAILVAFGFALLGCTGPIWFYAVHGLGKIESVTVIGSAVFIFAAFGTGLLIGALISLFTVDKSSDINPSSSDDQVFGNPD